VTVLQAMGAKTVIAAASMASVAGCGAIGESLGLGWRTSLILLAAIVVVSAIAGFIKKRKSGQD